MISELVSHAKINLFLEVISKRDDGFHNLNSLMCFCDVGDIIQIEKSDCFSLEISGPFSEKLKKNKDNLIVQSIDKIERIVNQKINVRIKLEKNLPLGSGLGGGSGNAAIVIKVILKLFKLKISEKRLNKLLLSIGSDVPFCFYGKIAIVQGVGNRIIPVKKINEYNILLVNPMFEISTKFIFSKLLKFNHSPTKFSNKRIEECLFFDLLKSSKNDLQSIVTDNFSEIKTILDFFKYETESIFFRMSGSGSTCFGIFKSLESLKVAEEKFRNKNKTWWIKTGKILNQI